MKTATQELLEEMDSWDEETRKSNLESLKRHAVAGEYGSGLAAGRAILALLEARTLPTVRRVPVDRREMALPQNPLLPQNCLNLPHKCLRSRGY